MDKYIIIGLGAFGKNLALKLMENGAEVVAVDSNIEHVDEIQNDVTYAVCLDSTDEKAFNSLGLDSFDVGIVCIGNNFEAMLLTSVLLKNGGVKKVITRASDPIHIKILKAIGIDEIVTPEIEVSEKLAYRLLYRNIFDIIHIDEKMAVARIKAPEDFIGKSIGQLNLRAKFGINVIAIEKNINDEQPNKKGKDKNSKEKEIINNSPGADTIIKKDSILLVSGDADNLNRLSKII